MDNVTLTILLTIWSLFLMYIIVWKMKMIKFEDQMHQAMKDLIGEYVDSLKYKVDGHLESQVKEVLKDKLIEARVIDRKVELRFVDKE